jgi:S-adenosylmethionine:tRNA ribosyltransferase-isomerase
MELKDFEYFLPEDLIARYPLPERDSSRLMVLDRRTGGLEHRAFRDIGNYLRPGDVLVLNDTRVMQARLLGRKSSGGRIELLACGRTLSGKEAWNCLLKPSKGIKIGSRLFFDGGSEALVVSAGADGMWVCEFNGSGIEILERIGKVPLPPYLKREAEEGDRLRYQTVFADKSGAVAAPTAGLHFTEEILDGIKGLGVEVHYITLHTGPGTFMPVRVSDIREHRMLKEYYKIEPAAFEAVSMAKREGRRIVAVGSTSTRALEAAVAGGFDKVRLEGETDIFIHPGFEFRAVDCILTNFHLPGSTLIMMVAAFAGLENIMCAYDAAIKERYRFFSYGDCMLIA